MADRYRIGVIGLGRMGRRYVAALAAHPRWELAWVCDRDTAQLSWARRAVPDLPVGTDSAAPLWQGNLDAVGVFTLADVRAALITAALERGLHVLAEKPLAATIAEEEALLTAIEASGRLVAVNLFNRNTWYHRAMVESVRSGQLGQLVSMISPTRRRICCQRRGISPRDRRFTTAACITSISPGGTPVPSTPPGTRRACGYGSGHSRGGLTFTVISPPASFSGARRPSATGRARRP